MHRTCIQTIGQACSYTAGAYLMSAQNVRENDISLEYYPVYLSNGTFISQKNTPFKELEKHSNKRSFVLTIKRFIE